METNILMWALAGFATLIVTMQLVPAAMTLVGMLKGIFAPSDYLVPNKNKEA